jgi:gamma-glutamyltranspeptidase/glutathione hydrolase
MVVSAHPLATQAGVKMLKQGGNAIDAAVATTLAISVVEPFSAGIGGGGFMVAKVGKETTALDFRERAPQKASRNMYLDAQGKVIANASLEGHLAAGVPGTIAGLAAAHRKYGKLPWNTVVRPAIELAQQGFIVSEIYSQQARLKQQLLAKNPAARQIFTRNAKPLQPGDRLVQRDLARTLTAIAQNPQTFYRGWIAQAIDRDMRRNGGLITLTDLKSYRPQWRTPLCGNFRQYRVCSMPPPSSGAVHLLQILNTIGDTKPEKMRGEKGLQRAGGVIPPESNDTSHITVVDKQRNAVSLTFTVNYRFGAGVVVPGTGILLNDEMDDFAIAPGVPNVFGLVGGEANAIEPRKTPLSSMTPAIVTENDKFRLALGAPGGSTIITTVLQILLNILEYKMDAGAAVAAGRFHHQWQPDVVTIERQALEPATISELQRRGHQVKLRDHWGNANAIQQLPDGRLEGAADPRGEGTAIGW